LDIAFLMKKDKQNRRGKEEASSEVSSFFFLRNNIGLSKFPVKQGKGLYRKAIFQ